MEEAKEKAAALLEEKAEIARTDLFEIRRLTKEKRALIKKLKE